MNHAYTWEQLQALPAGSPVWQENPSGPGERLRWWPGGFTPGQGYIRLRVNPSGPEETCLASGVPFYPSRLALLRARAERAKERLAAAVADSNRCQGDLIREENNPTPAEGPERALLRRLGARLKLGPLDVDTGNEGAALVEEIDRVLGVSE